MTRSMQNALNIKASQCLAQNVNKELVKKYFTQNLIIFVTYVSFIYLPIILLGDNLFELAGIEQELAEGARSVAIKLFASDILEFTKILILSILFPFSV